ncbi:MAG: pyridoxamine 5'-phosphate oxidase, partial [Gemmatimonadota bacterium]|nr:pyridoxamine 5'-phosphate oxidase [Gemmatimonadota bacterium]
MSFRSTLRALFTLGRGVSKGIPELTASDDPIRLFGRWFDDAKRAGIFLPEAMTVATATPDGAPSARMMLLKGVDEHGFVFYTNYDSRKAADLGANPRGALVLHWAILQRQVRVEGHIERVSEAESAAYFRTRPRGSRIAAWSSQQSAPLSSRAELERRVADVDRRYPGDEVPLPAFWGGYRLRPER